MVSISLDEHHIEAQQKKLRRKRMRTNKTLITKAQLYTITTNTI